MSGPLYRVVDAAYEKRSIALSSNLHPAGFDELLPKTIANATVDQLLHHAHARGDRLTEADEERAARPARNTVLTVGTVLFLAERGDKTMLATITLATREGVFGVWLGSTVGMVVVFAGIMLVEAI